MSKLYYFDYNSLYPTVMATLKFCVGKPISFVGDIRSVEPGARGFFYCNIYCPLYINKPILQRRIKTSEGIRTIAGVGSWTGWISSIEMDNALQYGYKFNILKGYKFEEEVIFKEYVFKMYNLRQQYPKDNPMNFIAKLLMIALYGRFGMQSVQPIVEIFNTNILKGTQDLKDVLNKHGEYIQEHFTIDNFEIIVRPGISNYDRDNSFDLFHGSDVNIAIAADIAAGGRIAGSIFKMNEDIYGTLYYTDTDSFVLSKKLPDEMVGDKLGQLKLEHVIESGFFLAPKVYGLLTLPL